MIHEGQSFEQQCILLALGNAPAMMAVYRQEGDGIDQVVVHNIHMPLVINDARWTILKVVYSL